MTGIQKKFLKNFKNKTFQKEFLKAFLKYYIKNNDDLPFLCSRIGDWLDQPDLDVRSNIVNIYFPEYIDQGIYFDFLSCRDKLSRDIREELLKSKISLLKHLCNAAPKNSKQIHFKISDWRGKL